MKISTLLAATAALLLVLADAFSGNKPAKNAAAQTDKVLSRSAFVAGTVGSAFLATTAPALGKTVEDADLTGMKAKANEKACLDRCIYECTKGGKSKADCTASCKTECSTAEGQLTYATPGGKKGSE